MLLKTYDKMSEERKKEIEKIAVGNAPEKEPEKQGGVGRGGTV
jgi:hypothetical protein